MATKSAPATMDEGGFYESRREREFYRYFEPIRTLTKNGPPLCDLHQKEDSRPGWRPSSSPDLALTAFCQLGALRVNTRRAMLFFFDKDFAYVLAEATRSLSLLDDSIQDIEDHIWLGHSKIPRGFSVCEKTTIHCANTHDVRDPNPGTDFLHVINDLREDTTFCDRPFVKGGIRARFYAGVPITTPRGINIGAYCVLDDKPRDGLTESETQFLRHMSATVMSHLEGARAKTQHYRGNRMIDGLGAFVDGASDLGRAADDEFINRAHGRASMTHMRNASLRKVQSTSSSNGHSVVGSRKSSASKTSEVLHRESLGPSSVPSPRTLFEKETQTPPMDPRVSSLASEDRAGASRKANRKPNDFRAELVSPNMQRTYARATSILRDALEVDGAIFFDAAITSYGGLVPSSPTSTQSEASSDHAQSSSEEQDNTSMTEASRIDGMRDRQCAILAASVRHEDEASPESVAGNCISERLLRRLLHRYRQGKVWNFNGDGHTSSDDAEERAPDERNSDGLSRRKEKKRLQTEDGKQLARLIPGVRSLAVIGLWDQVRERWVAAGMVWSCDAFRILTEDFELPFLTAFADVVVAEMHRMEAQKSDQAKVDFISSISHELRSPLHGILGSGECIQEHNVDEFTQGLVSQIMTCGKTLLDIVDHLLDYSKINYYGRPRTSSQAEESDKSRRLSSAGRTPYLGSITSLDADVSLAAVTEEVVDTAFYSFCCNHSKQTILTHQVAVVLDIDQASGVDWNCRVALGAWKRVVINLIGNALKYTKSGYIHVSLTWKKSRAVLRIKDSGRGMSKAFLKDRLFTAFAQEDTFADGTGLGLNLVHNILKAIGGDIDVESERNVGTTVTTTIPLAKPGSRNHSTTSAEHDTPFKPPRGFTVAIPTAAPDPVGKTKEAHPSQAIAQTLLVGSMIKACSENGIETTPWHSTKPQHADVDFFTEEQYLRLLGTNDDVATGETSTQIQEPKPPLIVLCGNAIKLREFRRCQQELLNGRHVELISQPAGPQRILKALQTCLSASQMRARGNSSYGLQNLGTSMENSGGTSVGIPNTSLLVRPFPAATESRPAEAQFQQQKDIDDVVLETPAAEPPEPSFQTPIYRETDLPVDEGAHRSSEPLQHAQVLTENVPMSPSPKQSSPNPQPGLIPPPPPNSEMTLLLVDDNPINLQLLVTYATKHNFAHIRAHNGQHAVDAYKAASTHTPLPQHLLAIQGTRTTTIDTPKQTSPVYRVPRVVLMDINMPQLNGYEATRQIRQYEQSRHLRPATIIALTGLGSDSAQQEAYACGIDLFLTKPVKLKELTKILEGVGRE